MKQEPSTEAGEAAQKSKWDLRTLVPSQIKDPKLKCAFWREALAHADISAAEEDIAFQLLNGNGIRKVSKMLGLNRPAVLGKVRRIYQAVQELIEANPLWFESFKPGDRRKTAFVINRNRRKIKVAMEPHLYPSDSNDSSVESAGHK
jgi:hypothetical protein